MEQQHIVQQMEIQQPRHRRIIATFDRGNIAADAGRITARGENQLHTLKRLARGCFRDNLIEARIQVTSTLQLCIRTEPSDLCSL